MNRVFSLCQRRPIVARSLAAIAIMPLMAATPNILPVVPSTQASGLTYDFTSRVTSTDRNGASKEQVVLRGHAAIQGDKARVDIEPVGASGAMPRGMYLLILDGGRRFVWINPSQKQYFETETFTMLANMNAIMQGNTALIKMNAANVHIDAEKVGPGPALLGHPTVHYRVTQRMDMTTKIFMKTTKTHDESVIDYYYAPNLQNFVNPFLSNTQAMTGQVTMFGKEYMQQMRAAQAKLYHGGAPLKTVIRSTRTDESGTTQTTTAIMEVGNLQTRPVPDAQFAIPSGYAKIEAPAVPAVTGELKTGDNAEPSIGDALHPRACALHGSDGSVCQMFRMRINV